MDVRLLRTPKSWRCLLGQPRALVIITTSWAVAPCLVRTCSTCLVISSSGGAVTTLQACTSHHVPGWTVFKPHAWLMMLLLNWGVTPVYYVYSIKSLYVWQPEHPRAPANIIYMYGTLSIQELLANILATAWCTYCLPHVLLQLSWRTCLMCDLATHLHIRPSKQPHAHVFITAKHVLVLSPAIQWSSIVWPCHRPLQDIPMLLVFVPTLSSEMQSMVISLRSVNPGWMCYEAIYEVKNQLNLWSSIRATF